MDSFVFIGKTGKEWWRETEISCSLVHVKNAHSNQETQWKLSLSHSWGWQRSRCLKHHLPTRVPHEQEAGVKNEADRNSGTPVWM